MSNIWDDFNTRKESLFRLTNARKVILWGRYGYNTWFLEHLFRISNKSIDFIVDDGQVNPRIPITRSCELSDISRDNSVIILTDNDNLEIENMISQKGYIKDVDYVLIKDFFLPKDQMGSVSYFGYLESNYPGVDISERRTTDEIEVPRIDCLMYSPGIGYGLADVLEEFYFVEDDAVFDFGCGKGGALILFEKYGIKRYGGVEYDRRLYEIAKLNFSILGLESSGIINEDAVNMTEELDNYNYFFMYNPFEGETFRRVVANIENSWNRNPRKITLIYSGPYCHNTVVKNGYFRLTKRIYTDYSVRYVNIYVIGAKK